MNDLFPTFRKLSYFTSSSFAESPAFKSLLLAVVSTSVFLPLLVLFEAVMVPLFLVWMAAGVIGLLFIIGRPASLRDALLRGLSAAAIPTALLALVGAGVAATAEPLGGAFILLAAALCALCGVLGGLVLYLVRRPRAGKK